MFKPCLMVLAMLIAQETLSQEIQKVMHPQEVQMLTRSVPKEIEGMEWNRWTSENFTVLCINDNQAQFLHKNLESVKSWALTRWGLQDVKFTSECKIICVDDQVLFEKMFRIKSTQIDIQRDKSGKIIATNIFLLIEGPPSETVPIPVTKVCLNEFGMHHGVIFSCWASHGMARLNGSIDQIRTSIKNSRQRLKNDENMYFYAALEDMTEQKYHALPLETRKSYDDSSMLLCLMIRQEFGQMKFHEVLAASAESQPAYTVLGFKTIKDFDTTFGRFIADIAADQESGVLPDKYLQIHEKKP